MAISLDIAANPATGPTLRDVTAEYVVGGPWGGFTVNGGFLIAGAVDDVVAQFGPRVYDLMEYDDAVACALFLLYAGALAEGVQVAPAVTVHPGEIVTGRQRKRDARMSEEISTYIERQVKRVRPDLDSTLWQMFRALPGGCKMAEIVMEDGADEDAGRYALKRLVVKPNWTWAFRVDPFLEVKKLRCWTVQGWVDVDRGHFAVLTWQPRDNDPRGTSILRPAYMAFNLKMQTFPDYGEYLKKFASASLILTAGPDMIDEQYLDPVLGTIRKITVTDKLLKAGRDFANHRVLAMPSGSAAEVLQSTGTGAAFHEGFDRFDRSIFRSIVMGTRPFQEAKHGSKADTGDVMDLFGLAVKQARKPAVSMLRDDVFFRLVEVNWGTQAARRYTPSVTFGVSDHISPDLMRAFSDAWSKGVFDTNHRPWMWSKLGAPVLEADQRDEAQEQEGGPEAKAKPKPGDKVAPDDKGEEEEDGGGSATKDGASEKPPAKNGKARRFTIGV